jgi:hypothetical protein
MPPKHLYTNDEIILCTYAALYNSEVFGGIHKIQEIEHRSMDSINMKIMNIAAMLDYYGIKRQNNIKALQGLPEGKLGRNTNWDIVKDLCKLPSSELLEKCKIVLVKK